MYPALAEWLADVRALLPHHQPLFATSDAGPVTDADGRQHRQAFGLATFAADHLMIIGAKVAPVHRAFTDHTTWPRDDRPRTGRGAGASEMTRRSSTVRPHRARPHPRPSRQVTSVFTDNDHEHLPAVMSQTTDVTKAVMANPGTR